MEDRKYTLTFASGLVIEEARLNGNNFITRMEVSKDTFADICAPVIIDNGEVKETHPYMECVQVTKNADEYWFVLRDITDSERAAVKLRSDVEYLAMMTGVEL